MRSLLWMDFETGGLDPITSSPLEICLVETSPLGTVIREYCSKITPEMQVEAEAAKVNGYTHEKWLDAPTLSWVKQEILKIPWTPGCRFAGWNIGFDISFWKWNFGDLNKTLKPHYHAFELQSLVWPLLMDMDSHHLSDVYEKVIGQKITDAHTAQGDVHAMIEIYTTWMDDIRGV